MSGDSRVRIYCTSACPRCDQLKRALEKLGIKDYDVASMASAESITELRVAGVFTLSAPVLQVDDDFYTVDELFNGDILNRLELDEAGLPMVITDE